MKDKFDRFYTKLFNHPWLFAAFHGLLLTIGLNSVYFATKYWDLIMEFFYSLPLEVRLFVGVFIFGTILFRIIEWSES